MSKKSQGITVSVTFSEPAYDLLARLEGYGIYGMNMSDVVRRIVDERLQSLVEKDVIKLAKSRGA